MKYLLILLVFAGCAKKPLPTIKDNPRPDPLEIKMPVPVPVLEDTPEPMPDIPVINPIMFPFDSYAITSPPDRLLEYMMLAPGVVRLEGHTCEIGTEQYNHALGEHRAASLRDYLTEGGVQPNRIIIVSYGEEQPISDILALNRRVEVKFK